MVRLRRPKKNSAGKRKNLNVFFLKVLYNMIHNSEFKGQLQRTEIKKNSAGKCLIMFLKVLYIMFDHSEFISQLQTAINMVT